MKKIILVNESLLIFSIKGIKVEYYDLTIN